MSLAPTESDGVSPDVELSAGATTEQANPPEKQVLTVEEEAKLIWLKCFGSLPGIWQ
jgi:hypothetical protein